MVTIRQLMQSMMSVHPQLADAPVCVVTDINLVERGEFEGALALALAPVAGVAIGQHGLVLFVDKNDANKRESILPSVPPGFTTGDAEIDKRIKDELGDTGDDWKKGG